VNKFISIILIAIITSFIWRDAVVYGVFKIQQDFISENQCVNRNKPITQCNGSCVLVERLSKPLRDVPSGESTPILINVKMEFFVEEEILQITFGIYQEPQVWEFIEFRELKGYLSTQTKPPEFV
jgi:hypothetical protein